MPQLDGIDIYNGQGDALKRLGRPVNAIWDWLASLSPRPKLAVCKSSQGNTYADSYWPGWRAYTAGLGFPYRGPFHWLTPTSSPASQLAWFVSHVGELREGEVIQLDCEQPGLTLDMIHEGYMRWTDRFEDRVIVYLGRYFDGHGAGHPAPTHPRPMIDDLDPAIPWWMPWYGLKSLDAVALPRRPVIWQWGATAEGVAVPALNGARIDSNQIIDEARLRVLCGYPPPRAPDVISNQEDDMPLSDDDKAWIEGHVHDQAFAAVIQVLRSTEAMRIIWQQSRPDAPFPPDPAPSPGGQG